MVAYDAHVFSQLYEEDFLANLVAVSKPRSVVGVCSCCSFASSASGYALQQLSPPAESCLFFLSSTSSAICLLVPVRLKFISVGRRLLK